MFLPANEILIYQNCTDVHRLFLLEFGTGFKINLLNMILVQVEKTQGTEI